MPFIFFISLLILSNFAYAAGKNSSLDYSIPYFQPKYEKVYQKDNHYMDNTDDILSIQASDKIKQLKPKDIKEIATIGENFCSDLGESDLKLWFKIGENGSVGIAGVSSEAGIEVIFHCKNNKR